MFLVTVRRLMIFGFYSISMEFSSISQLINTKEMHNKIKSIKLFFNKNYDNFKIIFSKFPSLILLYFSIVNIVTMVPMIL